MKVVILAGGFGTRLSELTEVLPKPMVSIGGKPILWHIMSIYAAHGYKEFVVALGYKSEVIKQYFLNLPSLSSDFTINLSTGDLDFHNPSGVDWKVTLFDTGLNTMTGGRLRRLKQFLGDQPFMLTYGDGVASVNISDLVKFHKSHGKMVTVTTVHPSARFGELEISNNTVDSFEEKPQTRRGWINGGFFVMEPRFLDLIPNDDSILEREPLEGAAKLGELMAFRHEDFWQCMDTLRDRSYLEKLWETGAPPWMPVK
jgi:glucose-1-phosphate cytidylyltransferase